MSDAPRRFRFPRMFWLRERETFDDEIAHHLAMRIAELQARGMSAIDAETEARRQLGDVDAARQDVERADGERIQRAQWRLRLDEVAQDLAFTARQMRKHAGYSASALIVLALGVALFASALGVANTYLVRALPFPDPDRIVFVRAAPSAEVFPRRPDLSTVDWRAADSVFARVVAWDLDGFTMMGGERPEYADGAWVSRGYFDVLGVRTALGRPFAESEYSGTARVALISHALWQRRFGGDSAVVGTSVRMFSTDRPAEQELVTIVGVLRADAWHINPFTSVLRPLTTPRFPSVARLREGSSITTATAHLNAVIRPQVRAPDPAWSMSLATLHDEYVREARPSILALLAGAALALLVACANVAGMAAMRGAQRQSEFAVRAALGAGRGRLGRQAFVESLALSSLAAVAGLSLANWALATAAPAIQLRLGADAPGGDALLRIDWRITALVAPIAILTAVLSAWRAMRVHNRPLSLSIRPGTSPGSGHARMRSALMAGQIAFTFALLSGAALMARTAWTITHVPLGFEPRGVFKAFALLPSSRFTDGSARVRAADALVDALTSRPDVSSAAVVWPPPFRGVGPTPLHMDGAGAGAQRTDVRIVAMTPGYFTTVGAKVTAGRALTAADDAVAPQVAVVDESLARTLWPSGNAIGSRIKLGDIARAEVAWRTVVGVVADVRSTLTDAASLGQVYLPLAQSPRTYLAVLVRWRNDAAPNPEGVHAAVASVDESLALSAAEPLTAAIDRESLRPRTLSALLLAFSSFGLLLAAIGLASALAHGVSQRRAELALRLALGSSPAGLVRLVLVQTGAIVAAGLIVGAGLSAAIARLLRAELYGVTASDPASYAAVTAVVITAALIAAVVPARTAARLDPARAMRAG